MVFNAMSELRPSSRRELVSASNSYVMGKKMISSIMGWSILRCSSACRHDMESVKIKNLFLLECLMHSRASSMARASAMKME